ncbi:hypothetical protein Pen01_02420 [Phytomonospora endophytica]|nr:hypothetical protein Pen01_02420 [Phytomonospora endophytica]
MDWFLLRVFYSRPVKTGTERETGTTGWQTGLSLTGAAVLFLVLRLFAVTGYDWDTAFAVADAVDIGDAPSVVIGTFMADPEITAALLMLLVPLSLVHLARLGRPRWENAGNQVLLVVELVLLAALVLGLRMWWAGAVAAGLTALLGMLVLGGRKGRHHRLALWSVRRVGPAAGVAVLVMAAVVQTPWVPRERIETTSGPVTGYVLEVEPGFLRVLTGGERRFVTIDTADVTGRGDA